jgi:hypothetical protein
MPPVKIERRAYLGQFFDQGLCVDVESALPASFGGARRAFT